MRSMTRFGRGLTNDAYSTRKQPGLRLILQVYSHCDLFVSVCVFEFELDIRRWIDGENENNASASFRTVYKAFVPIL